MNAGTPVGANATAGTNSGVPSGTYAGTPTGANATAGDNSGTFGGDISGDTSGMGDGYCGDSILQPELGELCDDGDDNADEPSKCRINCELPFCGDGVPDGNEECDDANRLNGDGCSAYCEDEFGSAEDFSGDFGGNLLDNSGENAGYPSGTNAGMPSGANAGDIGGKLPPTTTGSGPGLVIIIVTAVAAAIGFLKRKVRV